MTQVVVNKIVRSGRRTLGLQIYPNGELVVRAPYRLSEKQILSFLDSKKDWILKRQRAAVGRLEKAVKRRYEGGEEFLYLGEKYKLDVLAGSGDGLSFNDGKFVIGGLWEAKAKEQFAKWYIGRAAEVLEERVNIWTKRSGLYPKRLKIRDAKTRWGSCGPGGNINLSWRLVMAPMWVVDYVVVHELAHLAVANHSGRYWRRVFEIMSEEQCKAGRKWLRVNAGAMVL